MSGGLFALVEGIEDNRYFGVSFQKLLVICQQWSSDSDCQSVADQVNFPARRKAAEAAQKAARRVQWRSSRIPAMAIGSCLEGCRPEDLFRLAVACNVRNGRGYMNNR